MKMFKMTLIAIFFLGILMIPGAWAAEGKIAYVDLSRLFDEYHKTVEYDKVLEAKHKDVETEHNAKIEKIRESEGKLALLTDEKRKQLQNQIETMKNDLMEFDRQKQTDLTKERNEKIREILLEIENKVSDFAKQQSYSLILNDRVLIYGDQTINITEPILKVLNGDQPAKK